MCGYARMSQAEIARQEQLYEAELRRREEAHRLQQQFDAPAVEPDRAVPARETETVRV